VLGAGFRERSAANETPAVKMKATESAMSPYLLNSLTALTPASLTPNFSNDQYTRAYEFNNRFAQAS